MQLMVVLFSVVIYVLMWKMTFATPFFQHRWIVLYLCGWGEHWEWWRGRWTWPWI